MRKIFFLSVLTFVTFSCSPGPDDVAKNFFENFTQGKIEEAKKYATPNTGKLLDHAKNFGALQPHPNYKFQKTKDSITGDRAWITFIDVDGEEDVLELVKIDGKWLVQIESMK